MERVRRIELPYAAWEAAVLPLNYTRVITPAWHDTGLQVRIIIKPLVFGQGIDWNVCDLPVLAGVHLFDIVGEQLQYQLAFGFERGG
jgi:hypothetical protein